MTILKGNVFSIPRVIILGLLIAAFTFIAANQITPVHAADGDHVATLDFTVDCTSNLGVGITYDGTNMWYSCFNGVDDLHRADPVTGIVDMSYNIVANAGLGALSYDATRNVIWAGDGGNLGNNVYRIDLDAGKNVTGSAIVFNVQGVGNVGVCSLDDGLAFDANVVGDPLDDVIYYSNDCSQPQFIDAFDLDLSIGAGVGVLSEPTFAWGGVLGYNSGLAIGGQLLFQGSNGSSHVWVVDKTSKAAVFDFSTVILGDLTFRDEGLTCDPDTLAVDVMWSKEARNPSRAHAFQVPDGSCEIGGKPRGSVGGTATMFVPDGLGSGGTLAEISAPSGQGYNLLAGGFTMAAIAAIAAIGGWYVWNRRRLGQS